MLKKTVAILSTFLLAFTILSVSVLRCCGFNNGDFEVFSASPKPSSTPTTDKEETTIYYVFPYQGRILPDSPMWFAKALRDRLWLVVTPNKLKKAQLAILFADKRILASEELFKKDKPQLALSTLTKAEKYLEMASNYETQERLKGEDTKSFLFTLANASLKHWQKINEIIVIAPEDIKPEIIKSVNYTRNAYRHSRDNLITQGAVPPKNPFDTN